MADNELKKGLVTIYTLTFGSIFLFVFLSIMNMILTWNRVSLQSAARESSLHIAEAGIDYYKWYLLHFPRELLTGTMVYGPFSFRDPQGKVTGQFIIEARGILQCGELGAIDITSTGWTNQFPNVRRTIQIRYARPSVANFASILNSNVWIGSDHEIRGPYQSNGGIRMDGRNHSLVASARNSWMCTQSFGCNPSREAPGVFTTANGRQELFSFPVVPFDFNGITGDIATIRSMTLPPPSGQGRGIYIPPSTSGNGYRVVFAGRNIDVFEITALNQARAFNEEIGWHWERSVVATERFYGRFSLPSECGAIFIEDNVWVRGMVEGKVTLVAANTINPNVPSSIWLAGNIEYSSIGGTDERDGLLAIAQRDISIVLHSPDSMRIHGIFVAQNGRFGRNHYSEFHHRNDYLKSSLEIIGSVISNGRVGTQWVDSIGGILSGYRQRETIYNPRQGFNPPPFLPVISPLFEVVSWRETQ